MNTKELLITSAKELSVEMNEMEAEKFLLYKSLLLEWNEKINLTSITDENEIVLKHFIDSLSVLTIIKEERLKVIDVGSGAGFPGVPVAILRQFFDVLLIDSVNKKVNFLNEVKDQLMLPNLSCLHTRAEELSKDVNHREQYDVCFSRAVANLTVLSELCLPFVKTKGKFIAMKLYSDEEIMGAKNAIFKLGGEISDIKTINIPNTNIKHSLIVIDKISSTPNKFPRKYSQITKSPIK